MHIFSQNEMRISRNIHWLILYNFEVTCLNLDMTYACVYVPVKISHILWLQLTQNVTGDLVLQMIYLL